MNTKGKTALIWIFSILFTLSLAVYQRLTGPTYPVRGSLEIAGQKVKYRLIRSEESIEPAEVIIKNAPKGTEGSIRYKRLNVDEEWTEVAFSLNGDKLSAWLPEQPPAGKLEYFAELTYDGVQYALNTEPVVIRFTGPVPDYVLIPHIFFMFLAMLFSTRTGIEAIFKRKHTRSLALYTTVFFFLGGMILGPIVQKYAFDAYWTGWPFGHDLTDNKTLVAFIAWLIAYFRLRKNENNRGWAIAASIILLLVYLIPHSMFGSELDYSTGDINTGK
ncbi:MAG: hypothetical protein KQI35_09245 [Bacteroidetes bacterium]|nr:hypothetical protein [Bacteroidota bacterium]